MSDEENRWKWNEFVEIGNNIHKMRGQVRILQAKDGLNLADQLLESRFIYFSKERYEIYKTLLPKIAEYLDGNAEIIQAAVREHFLAQHCKAGLDESLFAISFATKKSGIQIGDVSNGTQSVRYYIKTHPQKTTSKASNHQIQRSYLSTSFCIILESVLKLISSFHLTALRRLSTLRPWIVIWLYYPN